MKKKLYFVVISVAVLGLAWQWPADVTTTKHAGQNRHALTSDHAITPSIATTDGVASNEVIASGETTPSVVAVVKNPGAQVPLLAPQEKAAQDVTEDEMAQADQRLASFSASGDPQAVMKYYAEQRRERARRVQAQMASESFDQQWSQELSQRFESAHQLLPVLSPLQLASADCRQTVCALYLGFSKDTSQGAPKRLLPYLQHVANVLGVDAWVHHDAAPGSAVLYVAKADTPLPDIVTP